MANIFDYIDWRGDIPFETDPFNEVDSLILSWLAYTDFEGVIPEPSWDPGSLTEPPRIFSTLETLPSIDIEEANRRYYELHTEEEVRGREVFYKTAPLLLPKMAVSPRFSKIRVMGYINLVDPERDLQMSALTFDLGNGTWYVAYRGTDDTLAGWKEDFDLSYAEATVGQLFAVHYLEAFFGTPGRNVIVGGHSKGGNFAAYASVFCNDVTQANILRVYSNDGPGFIESVADSERFAKMLPRMVKVIPESSIVGLLMNGHMRLRVIRSSNSGVMQHDATSWEVMRNRFEIVDARSDASIFANETIIKWLHGIGSEERKRFVDDLFDLLGTAGFTTLEEHREHRLASIAGILKGFSALPEMHRRHFIAILNKLMRSGASVYAESLREGLGDSRLGGLLKRLPDRQEEGGSRGTEEPALQLPGHEGDDVREAGSGIGDLFLKFLERHADDENRDDEREEVGDGHRPEDAVETEEDGKQEGKSDSEDDFPEEGDQLISKYEIENRKNNTRDDCEDHSIADGLSGVV